MGSSSSPAPVWQRLHTWAGIVPLAGFLIVHLLAQAPALWGARAYARAVGWAPWSASAVFEVVLVYVPLLLHVALGLRRARAGSRGPVPTPTARASALAQWLSAAVLVGFVLLHVWQFRARVWLGVISPADYYPELCASLSSTIWGGVPLVAIGYLFGVAAAAAHAANGLYRAGLGLVSAARHRRWGRCCAALGALVFVLGALIVIDLATGSVLIHLRGS